MARRITVRGVIVNDGKLFSVKHLRPEGYSKDFWCTPGGGLEEGETLEDGVRRELLEETGIKAIIGRLLIVYQFNKPAEAPFQEKECLEFFFHVENSDDFNEIDLSATSHGLVEISKADFINPSTVDFRPAFMKDLDITELLTKNSPVIITSEL